MRASFLNRAAAAILGAFATAASDAATLVTIVDDDTESAAAVSRVRAVAERNGAKVTFAAMARNVEKNPEITARLLECQAAGHEIASHSYSHSPLVWSRRRLHPGQVGEMERDLVRAHAVLTNLGLRVSALAYPYGNFRGRGYRSEVIEMAARHYDVAFNSRGGDNRADGTHFLYVGRFPMRAHDSRAMVGRFLRAAAKRGDGWLVLMTHGGKGSFSEDDFEAAIKACKDAGCVFATASEAARTLRSRGWKSVAADETGESTAFDELCDFAEFHLPAVAVAALAIALLLAALVRAVRGIGRGPGPSA